MDTVTSALRNGSITGSSRPRSLNSLVLLAVMIAALGVGNEAHGLYFYWSAQRIDGCTDGDPKPDLYGSFKLDADTGEVIYYVWLSPLRDPPRSAEVRFRVDDSDCAAGTHVVTLCDDADPGEDPCKNPLEGTYTLTAGQQDDMENDLHVLVYTYQTDKRAEQEAQGRITKGPPGGIPTVSAWGMATMTLLVLAAGTLVFRRARAKA